MAEDILEQGHTERGGRRRWTVPVLLVAAVLAYVGFRQILPAPAESAGPTGAAATADPHTGVPRTADAAQRALANLPLADAWLRDWAPDKAFALTLTSDTGPEQAEDWNARWEGRYTAAVTCVGEGAVMVALGRTREAIRELDAGVRVPCTTSPHSLTFTDVTLHLGCLCARVIPTPNTYAAVAIAIRPHTSTQ